MSENIRYVGLGLEQGKVDFSGPSRSIEVNNATDREAEVRVELRGHSAFRIPKKSQKLSLKPGRSARIPVTFEAPGAAGAPITLRARYRATLQLWTPGEGKNAPQRLVETAHMQGVGPGFIPLKSLRCFQPEIPREPAGAKGNSPPEITISCYRTGTTTTANTGTLDLSWTVGHSPDLVIESYLTYGAEILPTSSSATDLGGEGYELTDSHGAPLTSGSFTDSVGGRSRHIGYYARNADGEDYEGETLYARVGVGYHGASIPGAGSARQSEADDVGDFLDEIDTRLNRNILASLPDFIEEWNRGCPVPDLMMPDFEDMDYLDGSIGTGCLADDLLTAMRNVLVYIKSGTMPRGYRPGTIPAGSGRRSLCEVIDSNVVYGVSTRNWVSICLDSGADELTLLHELFHYASTSHNDSELRAIAVSCCCFDWIPW